MTALGTYMEPVGSWRIDPLPATEWLVLPYPDSSFLLIRDGGAAGPLVLDRLSAEGAQLYTTRVPGDGWRASQQVAAVLENGSVAIAFHDGDDVLMTLLRPGLTAATPVQIVNTWRPLMQDRPSITALDTGGFVVAWHSFAQDTLPGDFGLYGQRFDADGVPVGSEFRINGRTAGEQFDVQLAPLPGGRFIAAWTQEEPVGPPTSIRAQIFNGDGSRAGVEFALSTAATGLKDTPRLTPLEDGRILVTWRTPFLDTSGDGVFARLLSAAGVPEGEEFRLNDFTPGSQNQAVAAGLPGGGFVAAWRTTRNPEGLPGDNIHYRVFDAAGRPLTGDLRANQVMVGNQDEPLLQVLADGSFVIAWNVAVGPGWERRGETALHARRFHADGTPIGAEMVLVGGNAAPGRGTDRALVLMDDGALLAIWGGGTGQSAFRPLDPFLGDGRDNLIRGTAAAEILRGMAGNDTLIGGGGADTLDGGPGLDVAQFDGAAPVAAFLGRAGAQDTGQGLVTLISVEGLTGGAGDDRLEGDGQANVLSGRAGNDVLRGFGGNDTLYGGDGSDTLNGGDGDDFLFGGETEADRADTIFGGDGRDWIDGGHGNDQLHGGTGEDTVKGGFGADTIFGNDGDDMISGGPGSDLIFGGPGDDFINGGFGHDRINGGAGADRFYHLGTRDHGSDWIQDYSAAEGDVLVFGNAAAARADFRVTFAHTADAAGVRAGSADVMEAFVVHRPTGHILWALVDGAGQAAINLQIGGEVFDLLA